MTENSGQEEVLHIFEFPALSMEKQIHKQTIFFFKNSEIGNGFVLVMIGLCKDVSDKSDSSQTALANSTRAIFWFPFPYGIFKSFQCFHLLYFIG